jgi:hypothetical protein
MTFLVSFCAWLMRVWLRVGLNTAQVFLIMAVIDQGLQQPSRWQIRGNLHTIQLTLFDKEPPRVELRNFIELRVI